MKQTKNMRVYVLAFAMVICLSAISIGSLKTIVYAEESAEEQTTAGSSVTEESHNSVDDLKEKEGWIIENGNTYYYNENKALTGWQVIGEEIFYFNNEGIMQTGETKIKKKVYYFKEKGKAGKKGRLTLGWVKLKGKRVYFSENGTKGKAVKAKKVKGNYKTGSVYGPGSSNAELKKVKAEVKKFLNKYVATNMSDYEKVKIAHDYLAERCSYETSTNWSVTKANTAYGALVKKKAQCSGYARAFKALCDAMDVKCYYVHASSKASNPDHQWNIVKVGKKYYHIDVQCNDSSGFYAVFLNSDKYVKDILGLRWDTSAYPKCKKNYF